VERKKKEETARLNEEEEEYERGEIDGGVDLTPAVSALFLLQTATCRRGSVTVSRRNLSLHTVFIDTLCFSLLTSCPCLSSYSSGSAPELLLVGVHATKRRGVFALLLPATRDSAMGM
jgi:hypothetical protein